ncbi:hypothetical protein [Shigella flexneri]
MAKQKKQESQYKQKIEITPTIFIFAAHKTLIKPKRSISSLPFGNML